MCLRPASWRKGKRGVSDYRPGGPQQPARQAPGQRLEDVSARAGSSTGPAEERARNVSDSLYRGAERARVLAAEILMRAAGTLRSSSTEQNVRARQLADNLEQGATYLRQRDVAGMQRDLGGLIIEYPAQALGAAFLVGFLAGRRLGRR